MLIYIKMSSSSRPNWRISLEYYKKKISNARTSRQALRRKSRKELLRNLNFWKRTHTNLSSKVSINYARYRKEYLNARNMLSRIRNTLKTSYGYVNSTLNNTINYPEHITNNTSNRRSIYERQLNAYRRNKVLKNYLQSVINGKYPTNTINKLTHAAKVFTHLQRTRQLNKLLPNFKKNLRQNTQKYYLKLKPSTPLRKTPRNAPKFFTKTHTDPRMKPINVKLNSVSNYTNMRRKIIKATNVPETYELRRTLLVNLNKKLSNLPRENYITLSNITPSKNTHYVLKNGNHPATWLYLEPTSFNMLKREVRRTRDTFKFTHPTTRSLMNIRNFKLVKR